MLFVTDASVLIDMDTGGLSAFVFQLEHTFVVPDSLFAEELEEQHGHLLELGLQTRTLPGEVVDVAIQLEHPYVGLSHNDRLALALSKHLDAGLLSGDRRLIDAANDQGVEAHGTIWLMKQLYDAGLVDEPAARLAYDAMRDCGSRLPWELVHQQLADWGG